MFNAIIACQLLVAPDNGMINCSLGDDGQASLGDTCTFTCNSGYELSGNTSRSCQINGNWSGTESTCTQGMLSRHTIVGHALMVWACSRKVCII